MRDAGPGEVAGPALMNGGIRERTAARRGVTVVATAETNRGVCFLARDRALWTGSAPNEAPLCVRRHDG